MTELVQNSEAQGLSSSYVPDSSASQPAQSAPVAPQEKMLRQSEVNDLVGRVKRETEEKLRTEYDRRQAEYSQPQQSYQNQQSQAPQIDQGMIGAEVHKALQQIAAQNKSAEVTHTFMSKLQEGQKKHEDYDEIVSPLLSTVRVNGQELPQLPATIWTTASEFENTSDIMYELGKNPGKLAQLMNLAANPVLVKRELNYLSQSLKQNEEAKQAKTANPPLSQHKASHLGMDNGQLTLQELKRILKT